jgi:hypothetical protein
MKILKSDLDAAAQNGIITAEQAQKLWTYCESLRPYQAKFQGLHVLYYFGGVLILASMSWFLTEAWENGGALMAISAFFALIYGIVGNNLWKKQDTEIPGGLLITAAVGLTPLFIYGFQKMIGLWPQESPVSYKDYYLWIKGSWFFMEVGTIIAASMALRFYQFPFITFPLALSLWFMSMDLTQLLFGKNDFSFDEVKIVSCVFGLVVLAASYFVDKKFKDVDFAFWTYLYGMLAFWVGLTLIESNSELGKFIYCLLNVGFIFMGVYLRRKVFLVFGAFGVFAYLTYLAWDVFKDSYAFPFVLAALGIAILFLGVKYQSNKDRIEAIIEGWLPAFLLKWRPDERA